MVAVALLALALGGSPRLAVLPIAAGEGITPTTAAALTEALAGEVRRRSGAEVVTQREIAAVLSLERQKAILGCETDVCMAELGGALGADRLVAGDLARLGESFLLHLRVVEVGKVRVSAQSDRRIRGGTIDDVLDALPAMVVELFPAPSGAAAALKVPVGPPVARPPARAAPAPAPAWVEEPDDLPAEARARLVVLTDGQGFFVALVPFQGIDAPLYAGDGRKMYRQRISGGSQEGVAAMSRVFWEPRARVGAEAQLELRGGRASLVCGRRTQPLRFLGAARSRRLVAEASFLAPPFRRIPHLLARDDEGTWFFVDDARDPARGGPAESHDLRLRIGRKGALSPVELTEAISDAGGLVLSSSAGRLVVREGAAERTVEWSTPSGRRPLTSLDVRDAATFIYGELGAYRDERLGTACDGRI